MNDSTEVSDPRIIGFWKAIESDYDLVNEFRSDGKTIQYVGGRAGKSSPFRIEGDYITYSLEQPDGSIFDQRTQYSISGDELTFIYSRRKKMIFRKHVECD